MARINLITRHSGESYGAVLQTYATCKILQSLGHKVTIINLIDKQRIKKYFSIKSVCLYPKYLRFWLFKGRYYPHKTRLMTRINNKKIPKADYTIVGSDQVWRSQITKENRLSYFLDFADGTKRVSLASSFGTSRWEEDRAYTLKVKDCLRKYTAISVRESSGVEICHNTFGLDATCLIDPTIAWGDYDCFIKNSSTNQIASFVLNRKGHLWNIVLDRLAEITKTNVLMLDYYFGPKYKYLKNHEKSPKRWLNEISRAKYVVTDSFHGVAFSLIFKKQFFVLLANESVFGRISSLLKKVGLEDRVISSEDDFNMRVNNLLNPIDYQHVEEAMRHESLRYFNFVKENING